MPRSLNGPVRNPNLAWCIGFVLLRLTLVLVVACRLQSGVGAYVGSRNMLSLSPPLLVLPKPNLTAVESLLDAYRQLDTSSLPCTLKAAEVRIRGIFA
eukprot:1192325-Prorocentrum_minimum.AAC.5